MAKQPYLSEKAGEFSSWLGTLAAICTTGR